jgi:hypothetical protein
MIQAAMRAEITALRRKVSEHEVVLRNARALRDEWRANALRYQKRLATMKERI